MLVSRSFIWFVETRFFVVVVPNTPDGWQKCASNAGHLYPAYTSIHTLAKFMLTVLLMSCIVLIIINTFLDRWIPLWATYTRLKALYMFNSNWAKLHIQLEPSKERNQHVNIPGLQSTTAWDWFKETIYLSNLQDTKSSPTALSHARIELEPFVLDK